MGINIDHIFQSILKFAMHKNQLNNFEHNKSHFIKTNQFGTININLKTNQYKLSKETHMDNIKNLLKLDKICLYKTKCMYVFVLLNNSLLNIMIRMYYLAINMDIDNLNKYMKIYKLYKILYCNA